MGECMAKAQAYTYMYTSISTLIYRIWQRVIYCLSIGLSLHFGVWLGEGHQSLTPGTPKTWINSQLFAVIIPKT